MDPAQFSLSRNIAMLYAFVFPRRPGFKEAKHLPAELLRQLVAGAVETRYTSETNEDGDEAATAASPLLLLNGHVCALSLVPQQEIKARAGQKSNENGGSGYVLREPYGWKSDEDATGFLLPRWMWRAVDGETVGYYESQPTRGTQQWRVVAGVAAAQAYTFNDRLIDKT